MLQVYEPYVESQYETFLEDVEVALGKAIFSDSLVLLGDFMHMWGSTMQPGKVLLGNMVTRDDMGC